MIQNNKINKIKLAMLPDSKFKQVMEVRPLPYATVQIAKALRSDVVQKSMMLQTSTVPFRSSRRPDAVAFWPLTSSMRIMITTNFEGKKKD